MERAQKRAERYLQGLPLDLPLSGMEERCPGGDGVGV